MIDWVLAAGYVLFVWWFSTGVILYLDRLPRHTFVWSMAASSVLAVAALYGIVASSDDTSLTGVYIAFTSAILIWAWHEMGFLMGFVIGPRTTPCPPGATEWRRFAYATEAILYHEIAIALTGLVMIALTWGGANQVGVWAFVILWGMRLSAKLNVFLGVPNLTTEFLPEHLQFLQSYFRRRPSNLLFPISITVSTGIAVLLVAAAATEGPSTPTGVGLVMLAALMILAILEHWFLLLPVPDAALWRWATTENPAAGSGEAGNGPAAIAVAAHDSDAGTLRMNECLSPTTRAQPTRHSWGVI